VGDSYHGSYSLVVTEKSRDLINVTVTSPLGFIYPTEIPVVVMAVEKVNADQNIVFTKVKVMACDSAQQAAASSKTSYLINQSINQSNNQTMDELDYLHRDVENASLFLLMNGFRAVRSAIFLKIENESMESCSGFFMAFNA
jgi:hypothetical protein